MATKQPGKRQLERADWEKLWLEHWVAPAQQGAKKDAEQDFLATSRTVEQEKQRLANYTATLEQLNAQLAKFAERVS